MAITWLQFYAIQRLSSNPELASWNPCKKNGMRSLSFYPIKLGFRRLFYLQVTGNTKWWCLHFLFYLQKPLCNTNSNVEANFTDCFYNEWGHYFTFLLFQQARHESHNKKKYRKNVKSNLKSQKKINSLHKPCIVVAIEPLPMKSFLWFMYDGFLSFHWKESVSIFRRNTMCITTLPTLKYFYETCEKCIRAIFKYDLIAANTSECV